MSAIKTALITGATGGIGQALCRIFTQNGYQVIATDKKIDKNLVCDSLIEFDLLRLCQASEDLQSLATQVRNCLGGNGLTVLVNNAAVQVLNPTEKLTLSDWSNSLNINLLAPFLLTQILLGDLEQGKGSVINIASVHAHATKPGFVCYATCKAALVGLTRALAVDLGTRIRVNAINPAATATPMLMAGFEGKSALFDKLAEMHPLGRIAEPNEVAQVALFLASERASFITGTVVDVDGGILVRLHDPD